MEEDNEELRGQTTSCVNKELQRLHSTSNGASRLGEFIKMLRSRSAMRRRWRQKANAESIQDFEIEDLSIEIPRAQPSPSTSHLDNLSLLRSSTPVPVLPRQIEELPCSSAANTVSLPSISQTSDYMPLKIAADLIPRFDGTSCSLTAFIKQCRDVDSRVKPADRANLLTVASMLIAFKTN